MKAASLFVFSVGLPLLAMAQAADPYAPLPPVPDGYHLIHGDILVRSREPKGAFRGDPARFWPGGVVPYTFNANVNAANQTAMTNAMARWEAVANVDFVPRSSQADYVEIRNSTGNNSAVGRAGGMQIINIASWGSQIIIAHELGHCLGYWHTQSRPDRDTYVRINWGNIQAGAGNNFQIETDIRTYGPYDFDSLMHYGQCAFSIDCPPGTACGCTNTTIDVLPPNEAWQTRIGQRDHLSYWDTNVMRFLYSYSTDRFVDWAFAGTEAGTFFNPYRAFATGETNVPVGGHVWILRPGAYAAVGTHHKPMTISAPVGGVTLGN